MKLFWLKYRLDYVLLIGWILIALVFAFDLMKNDSQSDQNKSLKAQPVLNYEIIGQGPFSLNPQYLNPQTPKILDSLFAVVGSRVKFADNYIHVGTDIEHLQSLHLSHFTQLKFHEGMSENLSSWYLRPLKIEQDILLLEAKCEDSPPIVISLPIQKTAQQFSLENCHDITSYQDLKKATYLGPDLLIQTYGSYNSFDGTHRIALNKNRVFSLKTGEDLFFNKEWRKEETDWEYRARFVIDEEKPLFIITDKLGFEELKIEIQKNPQESFSATSVIPRMIKSYPNQSFVCFIGKQKFLLKENDWVVKIDNFFHVIKSKDDILSLLAFKKTGPLVVIDQVILSKTSSLIRGKIFSPLRMSVHPFEIEAPLIHPEKHIKARATKGVKKSK